jgi:hypothetical protein
MHCESTDLAMTVLSFVDFLRYDEVSSLLCKDVVFRYSHVELHISHSKTDQYRQGDSVVIAKGNTSACPYNMLHRYITLSNTDLTSAESYLFKPCFRSGSTCKLIYKNKPLSYSRARECVVGRLKSVSGDLNIGLHSLRLGGATTAANSDVNDCCWKRHGRWKSESAKDGYVVDSLAKRLSVTQSLLL